MPKKIAKSAKDGKIVSKKFAKENPDTTFETVVPDPIEVPEPKGWTPAIGEKFAFGDEIASVDENGIVTIHEIVGGCQSERVTDIVFNSQQHASIAHAMAADDVFRRLA